MKFIKKIKNLLCMMSSVSSVDITFKTSVGIRVVVGKEIPEMLFLKQQGIRSAKISEGVTRIGNQAFDSSGLTSVTIPESVTYIGPGAFFGCSGLTSVTIPKGVTQIEDAAFFGCDNLEKVTLPKSDIEFGYNVFGYCKKLKTMIVPEGSDIASKIRIPCDVKLVYY